MPETKADIIRQAVRKSPDKKAGELIEVLKKAHPDLSFTNGEISTYRSLLKSELNGSAGKKAKGKPGRKPKAKKMGRPKGSKNRVARPTDSMIRAEGIVRLQEVIKELGGKDVVRQLLEVL